MPRRVRLGVRKLRTMMNRKPKEVLFQVLRGAGASVVTLVRVGGGQFGRVLAEVNAALGFPLRVAQGSLS